jgi:glycosyltransferase involved in cell wall biosynthesis
MIKVVDIVYYCHNEYNTPQQVLDKHRPAFGFADFISKLVDIQFVKHLDYNGIEKINGMLYAFFRSRNRFWYIPITTHRYIKSQNPDIVIVEGLIFPLQLMLLKFTLGKKCKFVVRHHGEKPFRGVKGFCQKLADSFINSYLFTSFDNASEWINTVIKDPRKCKEVLEATTYFSRNDRIKSQARVGITGVYNFLWVGRLINKKDPFTILKAFEKYARLHPDARLYMIYQEEDLLGGIINLIKQSVVLEQTVKLVGKVDHKELVYWFSAANFYISGSHAESSSYALLEAMACGCIPLVTAIPSFKKITAKGKYGFLYPPADVEALTALLNSFDKIQIDACRAEVEKYFKENLDFKNIADTLYHVLTQL